MIGWALVSSPKEAAKRLCSRGEVLLGEEDDLVVEQGLADGAHGGRLELDVEVEAADHPTNGPRERLDVELDGGAGGAGRGHDEVLSGWRDG